MSATPATDSRTHRLAQLPDDAERLVERHQRSIEVFTRLGWLAKGVVYLLFGVTAIAIAQQSAPEDEASPQGALGQILDAPAGRWLLGLVAVGLLLYSLWRCFSAVLVKGGDASAWADRAGYAFSAVFYVLLAVTAATTALSGRESGDASTVETLSRSMLENTAGRWLLGIGGLVTIGVGLYFTVSKGVMRSFTEDVAGVDADGAGNDGIDHGIWIAGVTGWIGRGVATVLVGYFVVRSAVEFDPDEARGFDRALREAAASGLGSILVWVTAVGLIAYGAFCLLTYRRRTLGDTS